MDADGDPGWCTMEEGRTKLLLGPIPKGSAAAGPTATRMATTTQQLHARHARTEPTLDVARANVRLAPLGGLIWTTTRLRRAYNVGPVRFG